ncbi:MAG: ABC-F family ATP-binding cassette domain-containing protein [Caldilineaceae bacterium]|nr:ABC-F family ATP-binding cassette domain-containing protein [Caldilineaceae bacterium]
MALLALQGANFLLLDEPTNHLDLPAQEVLQAMLEEYEGTILLISHDRYLVAHLATEIWDLRDGYLTIFGGGYAEFVSHSQGATLKA